MRSGLGLFFVGTVEIYRFLQWTCWPGLAEPLETLHSRCRIQRINVLCELLSDLLARQAIHLPNFNLSISQDEDRLRTESVRRKMCKLECAPSHVFTDSVLCFGIGTMIDASNLITKRWNDHIVSKGVTGTDSQDSVNLANPMLAATPCPSPFTFHVFLCSTTTEIKEEIEKLAWDAERAGGGGERRGERGLRGRGSTWGPKGGGGPWLETPQGD